ncbi:hypothetical protein TorRG33x02_149470 [Trema orientale]|uniref:Uncharacterized protein n=1 Tax=Trema orientale TaxID=63057 RepID=A0A2P5EUR7_TREOI|nr:hypothetical protein TorRG33x02_149470 [Trema orientale]
MLQMLVGCFILQRKVGLRDLLVSYFNNLFHFHWSLNMVGSYYLQPWQDRIIKKAPTSDKN